MLVVALMNPDRYTNRGNGGSSNRCLMFIIQMDPENILVKLHTQTEENEGDDESKPFYLP